MPINADCQSLCGVVVAAGVDGNGMARIEDIRPLPHSSSVGGRVAGPTLRAVDEETVHLVILGVQ
jgi:hypothetical protein